MSEGWLRFFKGNPGLRELRVEYETLSWKKDEMMRIIQRNKHWKLPVRREGGNLKAHELEGYLSAEETQLQEWKWKGPSKLDGVTWAHHGTADEIEYVVVTDTWKFVEEELEEKELEGRLTGMMAAPAMRHVRNPRSAQAMSRHARLLNRLRRRGEDPLE